MLTLCLNGHPYLSTWYNLKTMARQSHVGFRARKAKYVMTTGCVILRSDLPLWLFTEFRDMRNTHELQTQVLDKNMGRWHLVTESLMSPWRTIQIPRGPCWYKHNGALHVLKVINIRYFGFHEYLQYSSMINKPDSDDLLHILPPEELGTIRVEICRVTMSQRSEVSSSDQDNLKKQPDCGQFQFHEKTKKLGGHCVR